MRLPLWSSLLAACWLAGVAVTGGCATAAQQKDKLLKRAAFDLKCTKDELSVTKLDERTRGVRGCGRQATYVRSCSDDYNINCTWVMNSAGHDRDDEE
jgi:hypothetical protein